MKMCSFGYSARTSLRAPQDPAVSCAHLAGIGVLFTQVARLARESTLGTFEVDGTRIRAMARLDERRRQANTQRGRSDDTGRCPKVPGAESRGGTPCKRDFSIPAPKAQARCKLVGLALRMRRMGPMQMAWGQAAGERHPQ